jgi:hypothetical protein
MAHLEPRSVGESGEDSQIQLPHSDDGTMTDERKRPGAGFYAAVVVAVLLAYPVLLGPCCWLSSRTGLGTSIVSTVYEPIFRALSPVYNGTSRPLKMLMWYSELCAAEGWNWGPRGQFIEKSEPIGSDEFHLIIDVWSWEVAPNYRLRGGPI